MDDQEEIKRDKRIVDVLFIIFFLITGFFAFLIYLYAKTFTDLGKSSLSEASQKALLDKAATWGQLGDFFGGLANPVIGWITIFLLILNLVYQRRQLSNAKKEAEKAHEINLEQARHAIVQSFEQTFFSWLNNLRDAIDSVTYTHMDENNDRLDCKGAEALKYMIKDSPLFSLNLIKSNSFQENPAIDAHKKWTSFYHEYEHILSRKFNTLEPVRDLIVNKRNIA
ncbi:hypothetical protein UNDKW_3146 [Undibacterium sp. KW1]|uniref:hypothetical protein n=1 Tax=Undibacterium sp. KW1 TaxID=2058624 RepID=UPI001331E452|nr:hypothetical protein [Undibacterium sp. KW1]BBB61419.1 hypothetical protein UNDKW_3146 [Undibacterium sp. KW1]